MWVLFALIASISLIDPTRQVAGGMIRLGEPAPTATSTPTPTHGLCTGDCDGSGRVTVDELVTGVNMALGNLPATACPEFRADHNGLVTVDELVVAVNNALGGCATATPSPTATPAPPQGRCRSGPDCSRGGAYCQVPDIPPCATAVPIGPTPACTHDSDCAGHAGFVCGRPDPRNCPCCFQLQYLVCIPGCLSDTGCASGQACTATHHCAARPCSTDGDCPQYFNCRPNAATGASVCIRRDCHTDANCTDGFCVEGSCYGTLGNCFVIVP